MADTTIKAAEIPLADWANVNLTKADEEVRWIYRMERHVSPVPPEAHIIRELISRIEACHFKYQRHIEHIIRSIGQMQTDIDPDSIGNAHPKSGDGAWRKDSSGRSRRGQEFILALQLWLDEKSPPGELSEEISQSLTMKVYNALGEPDYNKRVFVEALINRLLWKFGNTRQPLSEKFDEIGEQIDRTDICHYTFPANVERVISAIGRLTPLSDFEGCGSFGSEQQCLTEEYFHTLLNWLHKRKCRLDEQLGESTPLKRWLAACLAKTLKEYTGLRVPMLKWREMPDFARIIHKPCNRVVQ